MGINNGAKLTAENFNNAFMCKNEDTDTIGRIKSKYNCTEKTQVPAATSLALATDTGVVEITGTGPTDVSSFTSPVENGQQVTIINSTDVDITFSVFTGKDVTLPAGCSIFLVGCNGNLVPGGAGAGEGQDNCCEVTGTPPGAVGDLVYNDAGAWALADHSDVDKVAIAMIVSIDAGTYKIQTSGPADIPGHGYADGEYLFGDDATIGGMTDVKPTTGIYKSVAHVHGPDKLELLLQNEPEIITVTNNSIAYRCEQKILAADVTGDGTQPALGFSNLVIGKYYEIVGQVRQLDSGDGQYGAQWIHDGNVIMNVIDLVDPPGVGSTIHGINRAVRSIVFQATDTFIDAVTFSWETGDSIIGVGTPNGTWLALREYEVPPLKVTGVF